MIPPLRIKSRFGLFFHSCGMERSPQKKKKRGEEKRGRKEKERRERRERKKILQ